MAHPLAEPCSRGIVAAEPCPRKLGREITPERRADFGADLASVQWVINGYVLALASLTLIGGALADAFGKARVLGAGCLLFSVASVACAMAPSIGWLIAARVVQGAAAAIVTPASLALIGATYPKEERNRAIGVWAAASALTSAVGPVLGGWLTEAYGWQLVFWMNPPLALAAIWLLVRHAPEDHREARKFDTAGAAILAAALAALAWALSQIGPSEGRTLGDATPGSGGLITLVALAGVAGLAGYAFWERAAADPMTPPRLAENRVFLGLNLATLMIYAGLSIMFFLLPFELVDHRGLSAADAGLLFLPFTLAVGFLSRYFGALADAIGARVMLIAGPIASALAYVWMALARDAGLLFGVVGPTTMLGVAFAVIAAPITATVLSSVTEGDQGLASGINNAASRIAQLGGVALAAGVASLSSGYQLGLVVAAAASIAGAIIVAVTVPPNAVPRIA